MNKLKIVIVLFSFLFINCQKKTFEEKVKFSYTGNFSTNDEITFINKNIKVLLSEKQADRYEVFFGDAKEKIVVSEKNNCNMDAVGVMIFQVNLINNEKIKVILIQDYQDILTGSILALLFNNEKLVKTFRFCQPQYNYEKYNIDDVLGIELSKKEIYFNFDSKKIKNAGLNKSNYIYIVPPENRTVSLVGKNLLNLQYVTEKKIQFAV